MEEYWQNLPWLINPVVCKIGVFSLEWYGIMYLVGFFTVFLLLKYRIKKDSVSYPLPQLFGLLVFMLGGLLVGARLGYFLFYDLATCLHNPLIIINPFELSEAGWQYRGIYGMSYHGGLLGALVAFFIYSKRKKLPFLKTMDFIIPAIPLGYFWGRLGNFLNQELWGRKTESFIGMYFPSADWGEIQPPLRHPSQLYEALGEGIVLFVILWLLRNKIKIPGGLAGLYLILYGLFRFGIEYYREPDSQLGLLFNLFTLGQLLCLLMIGVGMGIILIQTMKKGVISDPNKSKTSKD